MRWMVVVLALAACSDGSSEKVTDTGTDADTAGQDGRERYVLDCTEHFGPSITAEEYEQLRDELPRPIIGTSHPTHVIYAPFPFRPDPHDPPEMVTRTRLSADYIDWLELIDIPLQQPPEEWNPVIHLDADGNALATCQFSILCWDSCVGITDDGVVDYDEIIGFRMIDPIELLVTR